MRGILLFSLVVMTSMGFMAVLQHGKNAAIYPKGIDDSCHVVDSVVFDECTSQQVILDITTEAATEAGKILLAVYGSEDCEHCLLMFKSLSGRPDQLGGEYDAKADKVILPQTAWDSGAAHELAVWVKRELIVVFVEIKHSADGANVLAGLNTPAAAPDFPLLWMNENTEARPLFAEMAAGARKSDGYDRTNLLRILKLMIGDTA